MTEDEMSVGAPRHREVRSPAHDDYRGELIARRLIL